MSYQIDGSIGLDSSWRGNMYTVQYKVQSEDKNLFDQFISYGSNANNLPGRPISVPCYVYKCGTKYVKPHWFYTFQICDQNYLWDRTYIPQNINQIVKEYGLGEITMQPEWFGVRLASKEDAGWDSTTNAYDKPAILNMAETGPCKVNEWIYNNATKSSGGSINTDLCPFVFGGSGLSGIQLIQLGINIKCIIYSVTFTSTFNTEWKGINGDWGSGCAPNDTTSGVWKAIGAQSQNYYQGGASRWRCKRTVIKAPLFGVDQLVWSATVNGGSWTW